MLHDIISLSAFPKSGITYLSFLLFHSLFSDDGDISELERKYIIDVHASEFGFWVQHVRLWLGRSKSAVHLVRYQDLIDAPKRDIAAIPIFIGIPVPAQRQRVAVGCSAMDAMRR